MHLIFIIKITLHLKKKVRYFEDVANFFYTHDLIKTSLLYEPLLQEYQLVSSMLISLPCLVQLPILICHHYLYCPFPRAKKQSIGT